MRRRRDRTRTRRLTAAPVWLALGLGLLAGAPAAQAMPCGYGGPYPGDAAPKSAIAGWMAAGATQAGLPGETPVMGALVESDLTNAGPEGQDAVGFFGMRKSIWDQGDYAGFPAKPELQLKWFVDQSLAVNQRRAAGGQPPYGADSSTWGEWVADVLRPDEQYRGRYQLRLADARALIGPGCGTLMSPAPPELDVAGKRLQHPLRRGSIVVQAACPLEPCTARALGSLSLGNAARAYRIRSSTRHIAKGGKARLTLRLGPRLRHDLRRALRRRTRVEVRVTVTATGASGGATSAKRAISARR